MRHNCLSALAVLVPAMALGLSACKSEEKASSDKPPAELKTAATNPVCPVSLESVDSAAPTRQYQGKTIGFCCGNCAAKWDKTTLADRDAMMAKATAK